MFRRKDLRVSKKTSNSKTPKGFWEVTAFFATGSRFLLAELQQAELPIKSKLKSKKKPKNPQKMPVFQGLTAFFATGSRFLLAGFQQQIKKMLQIRQSQTKIARFWGIDCLLLQNDRNFCLQDFSRKYFLLSCMNCGLQFS